MPLEMLHGDITKMETDAIVNAANTALQPGGGVCGAIFTAAGAEELQKQCDAIGICETGHAVITGGGRLSARHIIHTAGPVWQGGGKGEAELLRSCYLNSLALAAENGLESIAFPLISAGIYGYPKAEALQIALRTIGEYLSGQEMEVYLVLLEEPSFLMEKERLADIESYIGERWYVAEEEILLPPMEAEKTLLAPTAFMLDAQLMEEPAERFSLKRSAKELAAQPQRHLADVIGQVDESFSQMLLRLIDEKGLTDVEAYKRANIDRKLFSKIRNDRQYTPRKTTALALAVALALSVDETKDLLGKAGYALSHSYKLDIIVEYFIERDIFDIFEINEALFAFGQPLLGGK